MRHGDCGERQFYDDRRDLVTNPSLIVEVLSDSTEAYDRGDKLRHYRNLRSLRAYLLLSQYRMQAELFLRQPDGTWRLSSYQDPSESIPLRVIEAELSLAEVYDQVELSRQAPSRGWHPMECDPRAFNHWGRGDAATGRQRVLGRVTSRPHGTPAVPAKPQRRGPTMRLESAIFAAALLSLTTVQAEQTTAVTPIRGIAVESEVSGEVTVVNPETRLLTIRKDDGVFEVLHAPPEVERLDEVKIGDRLTVTKSTAALIMLEQGRDAGAMGTIARTEVERDAGSSPAGSITDEATLFGQIMEVDKAAGTVTVQGANRTETYKVADKSLLSELNVKKGDGVIVTIRSEIRGQITR